MVPGYFGFLANIVTQSYPASSFITRQTLGWEPNQPGLLADLDNGHYFPASSSVSDANDVPELSTEKIAQVVRSYIELAGHGSAEGHRSADEVAALFADNAIFGIQSAATSIAGLKRFAMPITQYGTAESREST